MVAAILSDALGQHSLYGDLTGAAATPHRAGSNVLSEVSVSTLTSVSRHLLYTLARFSGAPLTTFPPSGRYSLPTDQWHASCLASTFVPLRSNCFTKRYGAVPTTGEEVWDEEEFRCISESQVKQVATKPHSGLRFAPRSSTADCIWVWAADNGLVNITVSKLHKIL